MTVTVGTGVVGCNNDPESESVARRIETVGWLVWLLWEEDGMKRQDTVEIESQCVNGGGEGRE